MGSNATALRQISSSRTQGVGQRRWRRRAVSAAVALALLGSLIAGGSSSAGAAEDAEALGDCTGAGTCLVEALNGLVDGFTGAAGSGLWGWMMGGGQSAGISAISSELATIESTLTTIENELADIEQELEAIACGFDASFVDTEAGPIQSYYQTYSNWLTDMATDGVLPDLENLSEWANCAVGFPTSGQTCQDDKVLTLMDDINDAATAAAGSAGSIADCTMAMGSPPAENTLDDRPYYTDNVVPITNWYLTVNTQAMIVLSEAYHFRAWQAAGSPTSGNADDIYPNVCATGSTPEGCVEPITVYSNDFLAFTKGQLQAGGAPYSTDDFVMQNGTDYLLAISIEAYTEEADKQGISGNDCGDDTLVSSANSCGITVGHYDAALNSIAYGPYGYGTDGGTWVTAPEVLFADLLNQGFNGGSPNDVPPGAFLCTMSLTCSPSSTDQCSRTSCTQANGAAGLSGIAEKILLFDQLVQPSDGGWVGVVDTPVICFLDGGLWNGTTDQPFCVEHTDSYQSLLQNDGGQWCGGWGANYQMWTQSGVTADQIYPDFYAPAEICILNAFSTQSTSPGIWGRPPQYAVQEGSTPPNQFRWPALDWTALTCSDGSSPADALNPAGVPTLCGNDFDIWFNSQVPPGPTTTTAVSDATLYRADRNRNDGAGTRLTLAGETPLPGAKRVVVAFDRQHVRAFLDGGPVDQALLVLATADQSGRGRGHWVSAFPLLAAQFVEGNGNAAEDDRGTGTGATWNCAEDADISAHIEDCVQDWPQPIVPWRDGEVVFQEGGFTGPVSWDVTEHVEGGTYAWMLRKLGGGRHSLSYISREGAAAMDDPSLAPTLILVRGTDEPLVAEADPISEDRGAD